MPSKRPPLKTLIFGCFKAKQSPLVDPTAVSKKRVSSRRLSLSDLSNASSISIVSDLSNSVFGSNLHIFTFKELKDITNSFCKSSFLGEGGFGQVFKGFIDDKLRPGLKPRAVAVKVLDLDGKQGHREWLAEVIFLGQLKHPNLVNLIGYCCEDEHRLLVYEYMERGNLEDKLFKGYSAALPWLTRLKIATGAAKGLAFLHEEEKPVIYRDIKASNILLDVDFNAKLSDFGLAIDGPEEDQSHITTRVMGTQGYAAPEYIMTGHLTTMSDVYSFGVVLLELLTGKRSVDWNRTNREQNLADWARPLLKDPHKLERIMDRRLEGQFSTEGAQKLASLAQQCLSHRAKCRPTMRTVVNTLESLIKLTDIPICHFVYVAPNEEKIGTVVQNEKKNEEGKGEKKEKGKHRLKRSDRKRGRIKPLRHRAVHSDTALYKTLGSNLYGAKEAQETEGGDENLVLL